MVYRPRSMVGFPMVDGLSSMVGFYRPRSMVGFPMVDGLSSMVGFPDRRKIVQEGASTGRVKSRREKRQRVQDRHFDIISPTRARTVRQCRKPLPSQEIYG